MVSEAPPSEETEEVKVEIISADGSAEKVEVVTLSTSPVAAAAAAPPPIYTTISESKRRVIYVALLVCLFLAALDQNIVIVAIPTIIQEFGHPELLSWVMTSFMLTSTAVLALYGRFSDVYGRRAVMLVGLGFFLLGSALGGASPNMISIILARAFQGVGAGGLMSLSMIIIGDIASPQERPKYLSNITSAFVIAGVLGPVIGGLCTDKLSWRWAFYINLPLGGIAFVIIALTLTYGQARKNLPLDILGSLLILSATGVLVLFLSLGGTPGYAWSSGKIVGLIEGSIILYIIFIWQEGRHPLPILNLRLLWNPNMALIMTYIFCAGFVVFGSFTYIPVFLQRGRGDSAIISGLKLTPMVGGIVITSNISGRYLSKTGKFRGLLPAAALGLAIGSGILIAISPTTPYVHLVFGCLFIGLGMGLSFPVTTTYVQNVVPPADMANALSSLRFFQTLGGTIGVSVCGAIFEHTSQKYLQTSNNTLSALAHAIRWIFVVETGVAGLAIVAALAIKAEKIVDKQTVPATIPNKDLNNK